MTNLSSPIQLHVLIVGGGIAGLAAARALALNGHRVSVFERSSFANEVGAAVTISPNGTRVLSALGFDFEAAGGVDIQFLEMFHSVTLKHLFRADSGDGIEKYGARHLAMHRQDLHRELERLALLPDAGSGKILVQIFSGVKVERIDVEKAEIELSDGRVFGGDLLIGADGLHSEVRVKAMGKREKPIDTGWQIYRFLLSREKVMGDEIMRGLKAERTRIMFDMPNEATETNLRFVWYECRNGEVQNFAGFYRGDEDQTEVEDFDHQADKSTVLRLFDRIHPNLLHIFKQADEILLWRLYERAPLPSFRFHDRTLLIGDAGHPMTPFTAAGAVQALEDAGALLALFSDLTSLSQVAERLQIFDEVRVVRATRIQLGTVMPLVDGSENPLKKVAEELSQRDSDLPDEYKVLGSSQNQRFFHDYKYDVFAKSKEALKQASRV